MSDNGRLLEDGRIVYPKRGQPPALRGGFTRDPSDPWTLVPISPPCVLRSEQRSKVPCNRSPDGWREVVQQICGAGKNANYLYCCECVVSGQQAKLVQIHYREPVGTQ